MSGNRLMTILSYDTKISILAAMQHDFFCVAYILYNRLSKFMSIILPLFSGEPDLMHDGMRGREAAIGVCASSLATVSQARSGSRTEVEPGGQRSHLNSSSLPNKARLPLELRSGGLYRARRNMAVASTVRAPSRTEKSTDTGAPAPRNRRRSHYQHQHWKNRTGHHGRR